jgi:hypothetical protein
MRPAPARTLNPHSQDVVHQLFREQEFFDPEDLLQVKYEMLRQVRVDKQAIQPTTRSFGLSRPSFYQAQRAFRQSHARRTASALRRPGGNSDGT